MGEPDKAIKRYLSDNKRFADLFNGYFGKAILSSDNLIELDPCMITEVDEEVGQLLGEKRRDIIRKVALGVEFVVMEIENQTAVDYAMSIRVMRYDSMNYEKQLSEIKKNNKGQKGQSSSEFLSGFRKTDRVLPVFTLVIYYGQTPWDGALDLHGVMNIDQFPPELQDIIHNYPINLLEVNKFKDLDRFETDLGVVFGYVQHTKDPESLVEFIHDHENDFYDMDKDAYDVISKLTGNQEFITHRPEPNESGGYNMCKAMDAIIEKNRNEARIEGEIQGEINGEIKGQSRLSQLISLMIADDRSNQIQKVVTNSCFLQEMYVEYNI